ncbi:F-box family protein, putative, expressed [Zostera marina]|uniref:F-box family protein, putative, expressed n=1 Tax=Zostera marina TaxID=29655 RepID=A0A0K9PR00_ZOSMR|nr:F-box family protein, putative, expressed [Zostera marina]
MTGFDFVDCFTTDLVLNIFGYIDDCDDLVRCSVVSHKWNQLVIENSLCKNITVKLHPEVTAFYQVYVEKDSHDSVEDFGGKSNEWENLKCEHRVYSLIAHNLKIFTPNKECILRTINASSTDNYPDESIENTMNPSDFGGQGPSYWSSTGSKDSQKPETLTYELISDLCVVDEIKIKPFEAFFQHGIPLYSAKGVRFKLGHWKHSAMSQENDTSMFNTSEESHDDRFWWSYISPIYPMAHENKLQTFKLPKQVLCTGVVFQVELLGRVQIQESDDLYYICMSYVQVFGRRFSSNFDIHYLGNSERLVLNYHPSKP